MQTLLDNPLASPYTLGLAAAAGFGAALALVSGGFGLPSTSERRPMTTVFI
jgi:iron complex transport system permease protein